MHRTSTVVLVCLLAAAAVAGAAPVRIVVEGLEGAALENVRSALEPAAGLTTEPGADQAWLERLARQAPQTVRAALQPYGYYAAQVEAAIETEPGGAPTLRVRVEPGPPVRVAAAEVLVVGPGAGEPALRRLAEEFPLSPGDVLLQPRYESAKGALQARAVDLAYLDATFTTHRILVSPSEASARIELVLDTGPQYRFGEVSFDGAPDYPSAFLERYVGFEPGETFSYAKLGETEFNLAGSERFAAVTVTAEKDEAAGLRVPVAVRLRQAPRRRLRPGVGYGTDTGARASVQYRDLNVLHRGHELRTEASVAERNQGLGVSYVLPSRRNLESFTEFKTDFQREDTETYVSRVLSAEVGETRGFRRGVTGTAYLRYHWEGYAVGPDDDTSQLLLPGLRIAQRWQDNRLRPTRGHRLSAEARGTHPSLGSSTGFLQLLGEASLLTRLPWRFSLLTRAQGGVTLQNEPLAELPASLRFFAGGDRSVRGYAYRSLGPKNDAGEAEGGKNLLVGSAELERALLRTWSAAVFWDAGNAFNGVEPFFLYQAAGVGIRYYSPVGALRLDLARQLGVSDPRFRVHFTVGVEL